MALQISNICATIVTPKKTRTESSIIKACWLVALLATATLGNGCSKDSDRLFSEQFFAFGTLVEISLYGVKQPLASDAIAAAQRDFQRMHEDWHAWHPSQITKLNAQLAAGQSLSVATDTLELIGKAQHLSIQSGGLFNPAIGQLIHTWGFQQDEFSVAAPPDDRKIRALLDQRPTMEDITLTRGTVSSRNQAVQLDLGAVAKGYGIDRVIAHLKSLGINDAIVNCGGDLRAIGSHGARPWRIGIRKPRGAGVLASVELTDGESVFTSGDYERYFKWENNRYHHILDPKTGYPAQGVTSVTVIHHDAAVADAAATALFVAGPEHWLAVARRMGIGYVMLVDQEGVIHMNPAMQKRIQFEASTLPDITISEPL